MTNEDFFCTIEDKVEMIQKLCIEAKNIAVKVIGNNLLKEDLCLCAMLDRNVRLTEGFLLMIQTRNLTCAGAILRLQIDNCLRLFGLFIANDREEAVDCIIKGKDFSKLKDKSGKKLKDWYLRQELSKYDTRCSDVYKHASGFIHFSSKAFYQSVHTGGEYKINFQVGGELPEKINSILLECIEAYTHYTILLYNLMEIVADAKREFDAKIETIVINDEYTEE